MAVIIDGSAGVTTNAGGSVNPSTNVDGINYSCRAWVNFNGTGTVAIRASGNVSSITDNGTGDYTVNFTTAMSDADYSINGVCRINGNNLNNLSLSSSASPTTTTARFITNQSTLYDADYVCVTIFR